MENGNKIKTQRCFICGNPETLYKKIYKQNGNLVKSPNEFWICDKCFKIEVGKMIKLPDGEEFYFYKSW